MSELEDGVAGATSTGPGGISRFRLRLLLATALIAGGVTFTGVIVAERYLARRSESELQALISQETQGATHARAVRQAVLQEICERLARQPRIHAALEDNALDLLYPSARNELRHLLAAAANDAGVESGLRAVFYRFLDGQGRLIRPADGDGAGILPVSVEDELEMDVLVEEAQRAYVKWAEGAVEVFATPVVSTVTFEPIAALLVGFPFEAGGGLPEDGWWSGVASYEGMASDEWQVASANGEKQGADLEWLERWIRERLGPGGGDWTVRTPGSESAVRVIARPLNQGSVYPLAHEVFVASLAELDHRLAQTRRQILGAGAVLFVLGLVLSHGLASRFSKPVEVLAEVSERDRTEREQAEARLEATAEELRRQARFSADASHQLKTPVSVMRLGLEELLNYGDISAPHREEVQGLLRQTDRLTRVIDDLLLLSRLDSGRLQIALAPQQLKRIVEGLVDDFSMLQEGDEIALELGVAENLWVMGDRVYTVQIFQCLLENAWKYNRPGGRILIRAECNGEAVRTVIGNTGPGILPENRSHVFERFHRAASGENVPGYGLGLNMARNLAQLHGGELRLVYTGDDWTEFELVLKRAEEPGPKGGNGKMEEEGER